MSQSFGGAARRDASRRVAFRNFFLSVGLYVSN